MSELGAVGVLMMMRQRRRICFLEVGLGNGVSRRERLLLLVT